MRHLCLLQTCEKVAMHMLDNELAQTCKKLQDCKESK